MKHRMGMSVMELMVVVAVIGLVSAIIVTKVTGEHDGAKVGACHTYKGDIEIQAELWIHNTGGWPLGNLSDIGGDINYFPEGLPTCPVDGTTYTIDTITGLVIGHSH